MSQKSLCISKVCSMIQFPTISFNIEFIFLSLSCFIFLSYEVFFLIVWKSFNLTNLNFK